MNKKTKEYIKRQGINEEDFLHELEQEKKRSKYNRKRKGKKSHEEIENRRTEIEQIRKR